MVIKQKEFNINELRYSIRSAVIEDATMLSQVRVQIDGETEHMDRESGEAYIDPAGFEEIIRVDTNSPNSIFLVAVIDHQIVGFSRCQGTSLRRSLHKVEFGVCVIKKYWGYGMGRNLLKESISWADFIGIRKITLSVIESNDKAIELYKKHGFEIEGILKQDKFLSDGRFYDTIIMGRFLTK